VAEATDEGRGQRPIELGAVADAAPDAGSGIDGKKVDRRRAWIRRSEGFLAKPDTVPFGVLTLIALWWTWKFSSLVALRQNNFGSVDFDSGIFGQAAWLAAHGAQFDTVRGLPLYGHHATFSFYLFAPFYWLGWGGPTVMNVAQVLALAAVPLVIYWVARRLGLEPWIACVAGFVCLAHFSMTWLAQELFHPEVFAIAPLLAAYGFALRDQDKPYWALLVFAIIWKEDVALAIVGLGAVLMIQARPQRRRAQTRRGLYTLVFGAVWFVIATQILLPYFSPTGKAFYASGFYGNLGNSFSSVAVSFVSHPSRIATHLHNAHTFSYLRDLWAPFGFVNLLAPVALLIALPQLFANLLSVNNFTWSLRFHYAALPLMASMLGFVLGLRRLQGTWRTFAVGLALAASIGTALSWGVGPYSSNYQTGNWPLVAPANEAEINHALSLIPADAAVSASYHLVPHLTSRSLIFSFPNPWKPVNWGINNEHQRDPRSVQWVAVLATDLGSSDSALLKSILTGPNALRTVYSADGVLIARRTSG